MSTTKNKKRKRIKNVRIYGVCMSGLLLLVIAALFLPQVIFTIQDRYLMTGTEVEARRSLDVSQLNSLYEKQTHDRMSNFIHMDLQTATITSIDYDLMEDTEIEEQVRAILQQTWSAPLNVIKDFTSDTSIIVQNCKKYIVYGNENENGVALMMWYYDIYLDALDSRMRLLVDSETDTIYYVKVMIDEGYNMAAAKAYDYSYSIELIYLIFYNLDYYNTYYEAELESFRFDEESLKKGEVWYVDTESEDEGYTLHAALPYGELSVDFLFENIWRNDVNIISMGIHEIGNLVPEMIQD